MIKQHAATAVLHRSSRITAVGSATPGAKRSPTMSAAESLPRQQSLPPPSVDLNQAGAPNPGRPPIMFPLGYKEAAYQWWTSVTPPMAERNVLKFIPRVTEIAGSAANLPPADTADPFGARVWRRSLVALPGKNRALNELCVERVGEEVQDTLVMVHGYGAGLGFFYKNFEPISRIRGLRLYALDMLGMGNSSRPPFRIRAKTKDGKITEAEDWFIDALEEWRVKRNIERFTLLGHSLGGYLAVSYALKYPGHLKKLILASPVGIPEDPYAVNASMPEPEDSTLQNEFSQDQQAVTQAHDPSPTSSPSRDGSKPSPAAPRRPLPGWLVWLWDANISPFSIVRMAGPLGPRIVSGWTSRRFNHLPADEAQALHEYAFSIFKQKGSGEYALAYILAPGAYARRPVINRIQDVGRRVIRQSDDGKPVTETGLPIVFMYGENDWMDPAGGLAAQEKLAQARLEALRQATEEEKRAEKGSCRVLVVPKAGHHLYLDNPDSFNAMLEKEIRETAEAERATRLDS